MQQQKQPLQKKDNKFIEIFRIPGQVFSNAKAAEQDILETIKIEKILNDEFKCFNSWQQQQQKEDLLNRLINIIKEWSFDCAKQKNLPIEVAEKIQAKLFTFGSYKLSVNMGDGDIDTVCIMPKYFTREKEFFIDLYDKLFKYLKINKGVTFILIQNILQTKENSITKIPEAFVPILKIVFEGVQIDLSCCELNTETIDENIDLQDNNLITAMNQKSLHAINGVRVANKLLQIVPNLEEFRLTLKCIKVWAQNKGITQNKMGYLGGVSWAILVAKICQMFPKLKANGLLEKFFYYYSKLNWIDEPVRIVEIPDEPNNHPKNIENWKIEDKQWKDYKMLVITPVFPCMNSSHNVSFSSLEIMKDFFQQGNAIIQKIKQNKATWHELFQPFEFFNEYKLFIEIDIVGKVQEKFDSWEGKISSKIRKLVEYFEQSNAFYYHYQDNSYFNEQEDTLSTYFKFHFHPNGYTIKGDEAYPFKKCYFYGVQAKETKEDEPFDFVTPVQQFLIQFIESKTEDEDILIYQIKKKDIPQKIFQDFKRGLVNQVSTEDLEHYQNVEYQEEEIKYDQEIQKKIKKNNEVTEKALNEIKSHNYVNNNIPSNNDAHELDDLLW